MRLLLYNPNSDTALTQQLSDVCRAALAEGDVLDEATALSGPRFIGSDETIVAARSAMADAMAAVVPVTGAVLLGCFGDLGIESIRRAAVLPIVSLLDACLAVAPLVGRRTAIVTTTPFWQEKLLADVARRQLSQNVVAVTACLERPVRSRRELIARCRAQIDGIASTESADLIVLGGALLAVLRDEFVTSPLPVLDLVGTTVEMCRLASAARQA